MGVGVAVRHQGINSPSRRDPNPAADSVQRRVTPPAPASEPHARLSLGESTLGVAPHSCEAEGSHLTHDSHSHPQCHLLGPSFLVVDSPSRGCGWRRGVWVSAEAFFMSSLFSVKRLCVAACPDHGEGDPHSNTVHTSPGGAPHLGADPREGTGRQNTWWANARRLGGADAQQEVAAVACAASPQRSIT